MLIISRFAKVQPKRICSRFLCKTAFVGLSRRFVISASIFRGRRRGLPLQLWMSMAECRSMTEKTRCTAPLALVRSGKVSRAWEMPMAAKSMAKNTFNIPRKSSCPTGSRLNLIWNSAEVLVSIDQKWKLSVSSSKACATNRGHFETRMYKKRNSFLSAAFGVESKFTWDHQCASIPEPKRIHTHHYELQPQGFGNSALKGSWLSSADLIVQSSLQSWSDYVAVAKESHSVSVLQLSPGLHIPL